MPHNVSRSYYYLFQDTVVRCRLRFELAFRFITVGFDLLKICQSFVHFVVLTALHSTALPLFYANTAGRDPPRSGLGPWQGKYGSIYTRGERLRSGHVRSRGRRGSQNLAHSLVSASTLRSAARSPCTAGAPRTPIPVAVWLTLSRRNPQRGGRAPTRQKRGHGDATKAHQACTSLPPPLPPPHTDTHTLHAPPHMSQPIRTRHT